MLLILYICTFMRYTFRRKSGGSLDILNEALAQGRRWSHTNMVRVLIVDDEAKLAEVL